MKLDRQIQEIIIHLTCTINALKRINSNFPAIAELEAFIGIFEWALDHKSERQLQEMITNVQFAIKAGKRFKIESPGLANLESFVGILRWVNSHE